MFRRSRPRPSQTSSRALEMPCAVVCHPSLHPDIVVTFCGKCDRPTDGPTGGVPWRCRRSFPSTSEPLQKRQTDGRTNCRSVYRGGLFTFVHLSKQSSRGVQGGDEKEVVTFAVLQPPPPRFLLGSLAVAFINNRTALFHHSRQKPLSSGDPSATLSSLAVPQESLLPRSTPRILGRSSSLLARAPLTASPCASSPCSH